MINIIEIKNIMDPIDENMEIYVDMYLTLKITKITIQYQMKELYIG